MLVLKRKKGDSIEIINRENPDEKIVIKFMQNKKNCFHVAIDAPSKYRVSRKDLISDDKNCKNVVDT